MLLCNFVRVCWLEDLIDSWVSHKLRPAFSILENKPHAAVEAFPQQTPADREHPPAENTLSLLTMLFSKLEQDSN